MGLGGGQAGWNCQRSRGGRHEEDTAQARGRQGTAALFCAYFASSAPVPLPSWCSLLESVVFREQTLNWYRPSVPTPIQVPPPHGAGISNAHHAICPDFPPEPSSPSKDAAWHRAASKRPHPAQERAQKGNSQACLSS